jgi:predicted TPR repeat methyltransferase
MSDTLKLPRLRQKRQASQYVLRFPQSGAGLDQDVEWCEVYDGSRWERLRLHDYADIYSRPGLYEHLFYDLLRCTSPQRVVGLLEDVLREAGVCPTRLRALDVGAGNGMVGEELRRLGIETLIGLDIIPEAAEAAQRDRPMLYDQYLVADLTALSEEDESLLREARLNCLSTVSALGFGDIPAAAFAAAFNLLETPAWLAFNIKETFLSGDDSTGFCRLIRAMTDNRIIQIEAYRRYSHRLSISGKPLKYVAMTARKLCNLDQELVDAVG